MCIEIFFTQIIPKHNTNHPLQTWNTTVATAQKSNDTLDTLNYLSFDKSIWKFINKYFRYIYLTVCTLYHKILQNSQQVYHLDSIVITPSFVDPFTTILNSSYPNLLITTGFYSKLFKVRNLLHTQLLSVCWKFGICSHLTKCKYSSLSRYQLFQ